MGDVDLSEVSCPNGCVSDDPSRPLIAVRGRYGKNKEGVLLYCRKCKKRFAAPRGGPFSRFRQSPDTIASILLRYGDEAGPSIRDISGELGLDKDTVQRALAEAERHCMQEISRLMRDLGIPAGQFERFWRFLQRRQSATSVSPAPNRPSK